MALLPSEDGIDGECVEVATDERDYPLADNIGHWIDKHTFTIEVGGLERPLADPSVGCTDFYAMQILKRALARYVVEVSRVQFIPPALPRLRPSPPTGEGWQCELKFDGYRVQLHKAGASSTLFCRNGGDFTRRFPRIAAAVLGLPTRSCIIDGELIAAGRHGQPDFLALLHGATCADVRLFLRSA